MKRPRRGFFSLSSLSFLRTENTFLGVLIFYSWLIIALREVARLIDIVSPKKIAFIFWTTLLEIFTSSFKLQPSSDSKSFFSNGSQYVNFLIYGILFFLLNRSTMIEALCVHWVWSTKEMNCSLGSNSITFSGCWSSFKWIITSFWGACSPLFWDACSSFF